MASDISTAKPRNNKHRTRSGSLTLRILAVNMIAPLVLVMGLLYLGQYRDSLINAELETLKAQSQLFAGAIAEGAIKPAEKGRPFLFARPEEIEVLVPELARRMVRRLGETTESRTRLFNISGTLIGDSRLLTGPGGVVQVTPLAPPTEQFTVSAALAYLGTRVLEAMPIKSKLPLYPESSSNQITAYPDAARALQGYVSTSVWQTAKGRILMTAAAPVQKSSQTMGVVMLARDGKEIEKAMVSVRFDVLTVFLGALSITIFLSIYLAGVIGRPLKKLANAAEAIRQGKGRHIDIPDLTHRGDEIGELSQALRDMTSALWERMDSIEGFAADVAHELKNPLTSLRSAVETVAKIKNARDRERLMAIILHDVQRLDRLITDISRASRLDAELSRDELGPVDIGALLERLVEFYRTPLERTKSHQSTENHAIALEIPQGWNLNVIGNESRLAQIFENIITNALSFSPSDGRVRVQALPDKHSVRVIVEDQGPGIPHNKLDTIFERFYTERPQHEDYGRHSGLGLSIARQIVKAHGGQIYAENVTDTNGQVKGARFTVILDKAD